MIRSSTRIVALLCALEGTCGFTRSVAHFGVPSPPLATSLTPARLVRSPGRAERPDVGFRRQESRFPLHIFNKEVSEIAEQRVAGSLENASNPLAPAASTADHHDVEYAAAIKRTMGWVAAAFAFGTSLGYFVDPQTSEEFFAGYLLEQSLSVDNLLVFLLLFEYFKIPTDYQNRVLNWGIIGAIIMRAVMIGAGAVAIQQFHAVLLVFAAILVYSSGKILLAGDDEEGGEDDLSENVVVQFSNMLIASTDKFDGDRFFTMVGGLKLATPMFLCMVAVELSDVVFAVDSIPAVFGVTENPLVVFTSNMFAIMGLRSLYTILSKAASELKYLEPAVAVVLGFIGAKMIAEYLGAEIPTEVSLGVVATLLTGGVGASLLEAKEESDTSS